MHLSLGRPDFKLRFGIRQAKVKIFQFGNNNEELDYDEIGDLLVDKSLDDIAINEKQPAK